MYYLNPRTGENDKSSPQWYRDRQCH